jgi:hypothetical protein
METAVADELPIDIDLTSAQAGAERTRETLRDLRRRFDLTPFEYTRRVRIAPTEIPHSHPVLTLNSFVSEPDALLSTYLHEQMHWYLWRLGSPEVDPLSPVRPELERRYPDAPVGFPEGAAGATSTYLHLVVNYLEIDAVAVYLGAARAREIAANWRHYCWMYRTVLADWEALGALYREHGLVPIRPAEEFAEEIEGESPAA